MKLQILFAYLLVATIASANSQAWGALLTSTYEAQLETWLGEGDLDFTNIYTKSPGDTTLDFHAAADGQGRTFMLIEASWDGSSGFDAVPLQIIGGYNPLSWNSSSGIHFSLTDAERTAFIFNLTSTTIQRQVLLADDVYGWGKYQTFNGPNAGPSFSGSDIAINPTAISPVAMDSGYTNQLAFGSGSTIYGINIVGTSGPQLVTYGALEIYTFAPAGNSAVASVPEPTSMILFGFGGLAVLCGKRLRKHRANV